jgi:hypothetical protein
VPEEVVAIIEKMMAKEPGQRYQTPQAVMDALTPWVQTPIGPPPAEEMPRLCPAALGVMPAETGVSQPSTPSSGMPSPSPRKNWQVSAPPGSRTPVPGTAGVRPPSGSKAQPPAATGRDPATAPTAPSTPNTQTANAGAALVDRLPGQRGAPNGKTAQAPAPSANGAAPAEEIVAWERLAPETQEERAKADTDPKASKKIPTVSGLRPTLAEYQVQQRMRLLLVLGIVSLLIFITVIATLVFLLKRDDGSSDKEPIPPPPNVVYVSRTKDGAARTIEGALRRAKQSSRIIVLDGPIDCGAGFVFDNHKAPKDVTLEAEPGTTVIWRLRRGVPDAPTLVMLTQLDGFVLRGFTFDGEARVQDLLQISGNCPGLKLENLKFQGFKRRGISVGNLAGEAKKPVFLTNLTFSSAQEVEAGVYFDAGKNFAGIPANRHIIASELHLEGRIKHKTLSARPDVNESSVKLPPP